MRRPWTIGRILASALSLALLGFGAKCLVDGHRGRRDFERWQTAKPVDAAVDFSVPGRYVLPFDQTCSSSHGETVALRVPPETLQGVTVTQLLAGLKAKLEITDLSGSTVVERADSEILWGDRTLNGAIPLFGMAPLRKGTYKATVTVMEGAPALRGVGQRLEGDYLLCGLERLPATVATVTGLGNAGIGCIIGVVVCLLAVRDRRNQRLGQPQGRADGLACG